MTKKPKTPKKPKKKKLEVAVVSEDKCQGCGALEHEVEKLLNCSQCKLVKYCGRQCQREDWPAHKKTCQETVAAKPIAQVPMVIEDSCATDPESSEDQKNVEVKAPEAEKKKTPKKKAKSLNINAVDSQSEGKF